MELMDGFEPSTSPLPRVCSTPELHERTLWRNTHGTRRNLERAAGIEPASSAWKAEVLPLNYTRRAPAYQQLLKRLVEGGGFEPPKAEPSDLQSDPFGRSGTPPMQRGR